MVWCITVPHGAFIARRNGLIFATGNSGFPKSLDVSKAIDKRANVNDETHRRIALVAEVIRTHREAKGMERSAVSLAVVGTPSGACWNWEHQQLPSAEMWPAIKRQILSEDYFLKRDLPPTAKPYREDFHQYVPGMMPPAAAE